MPFGNDKPGGDDRRSVIDSSLNGLATVTALLVAVIFAPWITIETKDWVGGVIAEVYGENWVAFGTLLYGALLGGILFFASRAFGYWLLVLLAGGGAWKMASAFAG